jgi:sulfonate transport system substrate-binding protein
MKQPNKIRTLLIPLVLGLASLAKAQQPLEVRFGSSGTGVGGRPIVGGAVYGYVAAKGTLETALKAQGTSVKWAFLTGAAPAVNEAFANGLLDFAYISEQASLVGRGSGIPYKVVIAANRNTPSAISVTQSSRAASVTDLKGKKVALYKGTGSQLQAGRLLEAYGLTERDLNIVNMTTTDAQKALASGQIDGAFVATSSAIQYQDQGTAKRLIDTRTNPKIRGTGGSILVSEAFEKAHPEIVQLVVDVLVKASHEISQEENREAVLLEWAKSGTPYSIWKRDFDGVSFKERFDPRIDADFRQNYVQANEEIKRFKIAKGGVDLDHGFLEPKYVASSLERLGLKSFWP